MTARNGDKDAEPRTAGAAEPHRLLAALLKPAAGPVQDPLIRAVRAEIDAREARAYASGWRDALEAFRGRAAM